MEDSEKNKERKVLTDEELEQVSGGARPKFDPCTIWIGRVACDGMPNCRWDGNKNRCITFFPSE